VLLSKAAAMFAVTALGFVIVWIAAVVTPEVLDVELGGMNINALVLMMFISTLFYGYLALGLSAWTGKSSIASGVSAGVLVIGFVAVGLLPAVERFADLARLFPWYYYSNGDPVNNGVAWGDAAILTGFSVAFVGLGVAGLLRRDFRGQSVGTKMIDRLREHPATHKVAELLAGKARVSRIWIKTSSEYQGLLFVIVPIMFLMTLVMGPMYNQLADSLKDLTGQIPENLLALFGGGDMSTPEGWYQIEMFGLMVPISMLVVTIAIGSGAMAGEEKRNTMGLLLANPVSRMSIVLEKTATMVLYTVIVGVATVLGTAAGSYLGSLDMNLANVVATTTLAVLLGLVFGGIALALGGATGKTNVATFGAVGVATVTFIMNGFLPLNESTEAWAKLSPFHYYLSSDPLMNGMSWGHAAILATVFIVGVAGAVAAFNRRDLRTKG
jgi:ABC-2 type transport system permease protein